MTNADDDLKVRLAAFEFLSSQLQLHGEVLPRTVLAQGFFFEGMRVPLVGPQGIFKPRILSEMPLSITTVPFVEGQPPPYEDGFEDTGLLIYRYRGTNPGHRDNIGLNIAMLRRVPLIYFFGTVPGQYMPVWPVYIVGNDEKALCFRVAVDDRQVARIQANPADEIVVEARRAYITTITRQRLHQQTFRQRVLHAYRESCAICRLHHDELLEAAHILPDTHPLGEPTVSNGLALCKLHHAAFDRYILGIRPDLIVDLRLDILEEVDGPMLKYGLQEFQGAKIHVPRAEMLKPNPDYLAERYEMFLKAG
jgi:putative restriction endonuclease